MELADRIQADCSIKDAQFSESSEDTTVSYRVPGEVTLKILAFCEPSAANAVVRSCRENYHLGLPFLYRHVKLYSPQQVHRFAACVKAAQAAAAECNHFRFTETFTYALTVASRSMDTHREQEATFLLLSTIPSKSDASVPLFPKLTEAFFYPLPDMNAFRAVANPDDYFLHSIKRLHLFWTPEAIHSELPPCHTVGMTALQSVFLHHLMGTWTRRWWSIGEFLGFQPYLSQLEFCLAERASYFLDPSRDGTTILQSNLPRLVIDGSAPESPVHGYVSIMVEVLRKAILDLESKARTILEFNARIGEAIGQMQAPSSCKIVVNLPRQSNIATEDCIEELADRCRRELTAVFHKAGYPYRWPDLTISLSDSAHKGGSEWILRRDLKLEDFKHDHDQLWEFRSRSMSAPTP